MGNKNLLSLKNKSIITSVTREQHSFLKLELKEEEFDALISGLIDLLPEHYIDPKLIASTFRKLGKEAAAAKLEILIPETRNTRSGDIGEILATTYIDEKTDYKVPVKKLRWRDHQNMSMRGDDIIGILVNPQNQSLKFLKTEAKANRVLNRNVLVNARQELDSNNGKPTPHALTFIANRLREIGNVDLSCLIEKAQLLDNISDNQVEHLLFTVTQSNPSSLQNEAFDNYIGSIPQKSVGFKVSRHQELMQRVYQGVLDVYKDK